MRGSLRLTLLGLMLTGMLAVPASGQAYLTGVADEQPIMFASPLYQRLIHVQSPKQRISRYIAPYDIADGLRENSFFLDRFRLWYAAARRNHVEPMVAFYHSERAGYATRMPTVALYSRDIGKFFKLFPAVKVFQPWNEANRGYVAHILASPSASQSAAYYLALRASCSHCTIAGLDVLDAQNISPTLRYIRDFQSAVRRARGVLPSIWGLHNYSDTNRYSSSRTQAVLRAVSGQVWLTETGGVVKFGNSFPNRRGEGLTRAARALQYMFQIAGSNRRITRLYIFQWTGSGVNERFDAGLTTSGGAARPGYYVVCAQLLHSSRSCRASTRRPPVKAHTPAKTPAPLKGHTPPAHH